MHTVEILDRALATAEALGYGVRHEWLGGAVGGACEVAGKKWLFVDLSLNPLEQLQQVSEALRADPAIHTVNLPAGLREQFGLPRAA